MSKFRNLIENILKEKLNLLKENNNQVYRTYADGQYFNDITGNLMNKPRNGLWGCVDDSWKEWCNDNDFHCAKGYYEWILKPGTKVFKINNVDDFIYLLKNYQTNDYDGKCFIDFMKVSKDYDAVELTQEGNSQLHFNIETDDSELQDPKYMISLMMSLNAWDVPSICVFNPSKTVEVINTNF